MWISTITVTHAGIEPAEFLTMQEKKEELKLLDGAGSGLPGFAAPEIEDIPNISSPTLTIKRAWNQQVNAQAWVDYMLTKSYTVSATIEQEV